VNFLETHLGRKLRRGETGMRELRGLIEESRAGREEILIYYLTITYLVS
jgi:hypothetical protein